MEQTWVMDSIRSFFASIDKAIYGLMGTIYQIILDLAEATIISSGTIEDLYTRIYALLGIFMLFKVTFSFINYIINPDTFTDKAKGVQHLIKNVLIVLVMIIITPFAFDKLYEVQKAILNDQLIPKFIMGADVDSSGNILDAEFVMSSEHCAIGGTAANNGDYLSLVTLRPFYQIDPMVGNHVNKIYNTYCANGILEPKSYLTSNVYNASAGNVYIVDYKFFLSTIVGIVVCLILVSFCFDIAVRSIKLAFLEMFAPIPILSYIDPASSKNGMFSKWLKQVGSTWASLFVRLIALFLAVLIISKIDVNLEGSEYEFWVMLFIVIGALMFAKQLPKLIEELIPGLKLGGLQLNPFKKVADKALGGKQLLGAAAATAGVGIGGATWLGNKLLSLNKYKENAMKNADKKLAEAKNRYDEKLKDDPNMENASTRLAQRQMMRLNHDYLSRQAAFEESQNRKNEFKGKINDITGSIGLKFDSGFAHTLVGAAGRVGRDINEAVESAIAGAQSGYKQGSSLKFSPHKMGVDASKERDRIEKYSMYERGKDAVTDFFGIKNESGTTSMVKEDIKEQTENLRKIQSTLASMEHTFSTMQQKMGSEFAKAFTYSETTKRFVYNENYRGAFAAEAKQFSDTIAALDKEYASVKKELGRLEGLQKKFKPEK